MYPKDFINEYLDDAKKEESESGVPYLVTLGQAALESGWGTRAPEFNFFGIKAGESWKGRVQQFQTHEYINGKRYSILGNFRAYDSAYEAFKDHSSVLIKRFPKAFNHKDPVDFVRSMQTEHKYKYATDPDYVEIFEAVKNSIEKRLETIV